MFVIIDQKSEQFVFQVIDVFLQDIFNKIFFQSFPETLYFIIRYGFVYFCLFAFLPVNVQMDVSVCSLRTARFRIKKTKDLGVGACVADRFVFC